MKIGKVVPHLKVGGGKRGGEAWMSDFCFVHLFAFCFAVWRRSGSEVGGARDVQERRSKQYIRKGCRR